jgi:ribosomal protein S18 acetylase RimI-like enzyme
MSGSVAPEQEPERFFDIRVGTGLDRAFIARHWVDCYARSAWALTVGRSYFRGHNRAVDRCLDRQRTRVLCAHVPADADALLGFAVFEGDQTIHFVYVRPDARRMGLAKAMLQAGILPAILDSGKLVFSHRSAELFKRCEPMGVYNPYAFFFES